MSVALPSKTYFLGYYGEYVYNFARMVLALHCVENSEIMELVLNEKAGCHQKMNILLGLYIG